MTVQRCLERKGVGSGERGVKGWGAVGDGECVGGARRVDGPDSGRVVGGAGG